MDNKGSSKPKPTVKVDRRRRPGAGSAADRPRAEAPQRREDRATSQSSYTPSSTSGSSYSTGGGGSQIPVTSLLPLLKKLPWWALLLLGCLFIGFILLSSNGVGDLLGGTTYEEPTQALVYEEEPTNAPILQPTARPTKIPVVSGATGENTWLVMLYQDADDKILEQDIYLDLNEAERVGSSENLHIVAQVDRFASGYQGDGNWTNTRRFYITQDNNLNKISSQVVEDLGEANMGDGNTLVDFVAWAVENYPATHYMLILSDHGMGWPGGWSDPAPATRERGDIPLQSVMGNVIYLNELDQALEEIRTRTGIEKLDVIGMDACLMGHLEVFTALAPHARYAVASQETEPALGWAYTGFLSALSANPDMDGAEIGRLIVDSYIQEDQRIVDETARAEFLQQGSPMGGLFGFMGTMSASQLAQQLEQTVTLAAVDLEQLPALQGSLNNLAFALQEADQKLVAQARTYAQSFTSVWGSEVPPSYIDLGSFVKILQQNRTSSGVANAIQDVTAAINQVVIAEKHGPKKAGATGISIYFPNSQLYKNASAGAQSYTAIAERFASQSLWDDYLAYHYSGRKFAAQSAEVVAVQPSSMTRAPGTGTISISKIRLSDTEAAPGSPVTIGADISGENIGYVKLFVGYLDSASNSIFIADMDYLESSDTREVDGVYYPVWPADEFALEYDWEPVVFSISDGTRSVVALFKPQSYGATWEEATYTVDGTYTYADEGQSVHARLYFSNGLLQHVYGFTGPGSTGAPREIIPSTGDTFTVQEFWLDVNASGQATQSTQDGGTLTFGNNMFTWEEQYAAAGEYIVGLVVEDLDGTATQSLVQITVK
ncbi:MAG: clostripain-related cysteine peptidase [Anaerolineales bacterium]|nr:clostripain-related cysteine peptidase [Anaerolineales bacterium]